MTATVLLAVKNKSSKESSIASYDSSSYDDSSLQTSTSATTETNPVETFPITWYHTSDYPLGYRYHLSKAKTATAPDLLQLIPASGFSGTAHAGFLTRELTQFTFNVSAQAHNIMTSVSIASG